MFNKNLIRPLKASFRCRLSQLMCNVNILTFMTACSFFSVLTKPQTSDISLAWASELKRSGMIDSWKRGSLQNRGIKQARDRYKLSLT